MGQGSKWAKGEGWRGIGTRVSPAAACETRQKPVRNAKGTSSTGTAIGPARVERTLLSAAFDLDLDFEGSAHRPLQGRGRAALQRRVKHPGGKIWFRVEQRFSAALKNSLSELALATEVPEFGKTGGRARFPLVPISDPSEDPASAAEDFGDTRDRL